MSGTVTSVKFESNNDNNYLTYVDPSGILRIEYDRDVSETASEIQRYIDYSLNDLNIVSAEKLSDNRTFEYIFDVSGEVYGGRSEWQSIFTTRYIKIKIEY